MPQAAMRLGLTLGALLLGAPILAACSSGHSIIDPRYGVSASPRVVEPGQPVPKGGGAYRVGQPYMVGGRMYVPQEDPNYQAEGVASWYGSDFHGRLTANGEVYDMHGISAAHPTLPMPCYVRVTNLANQRSLIVRVNDRGPYAANREIDLSGKAAELLGFRGNGLARVRVEYVGRAPLEGSDDRILLATLRQGAPAPAPSTVMVASAKPFVPNLPDRGRPLHGAVPVPAERPFDLGEGSAQAALQSPPASRTVVARRPAPPEFVASAQPIAAEPAGSAPVSAYAPVRYDGSAAFASGRGLY
jgi:rare lipoprotein A